MNRSTRWPRTFKDCADPLVFLCSEGRMNKLAAALLSTLVLLAACGKKEPPAAQAPSAPAPAAEQPAAPAAGPDASAPAEQAATDQAAIAAPAETVSEMD